MDEDHKITITLTGYEAYIIDEALLRLEETISDERMQVAINSILSKLD